MERRGRFRRPPLPPPCTLSRRSGESNAILTWRRGRRRAAQVERAAREAVRAFGLRAGSAAGGGSAGGGAGRPTVPGARDALGIAGRLVGAGGCGYTESVVGGSWAGAVRRLENGSGPEGSSPPGSTHVHRKPGCCRRLFLSPARGLGAWRRTSRRHGTPRWSRGHRWVSRARTTEFCVDRPRAPACTPHGVSRARTTEFYSVARGRATARARGDARGAATAPLVACGDARAATTAPK